jgi:hypothetical protein
MRYAGILAVAFLAMLAAFSMFPVSANAAGIITDNATLYGTLPGDGGYAKDMTGLTCGNFKPADDARLYYFGFKGVNGYCDTSKFLANSFNEAWTCARNYCTTCSTIEDITDRLSDKEKMFSSSMNLKYCPKE